MSNKHKAYHFLEQVYPLEYVIQYNGYSINSYTHRCLWCKMRLSWEDMKFRLHKCPNRQDRFWRRFQRNDNHRQKKIR